MRAFSLPIRSSNPRTLQIITLYKLLIVFCLCLQEDAHISNLEFAEGQALFGIFDGHGGKEVAHYCKNWLEECLNENAEFKAKNYKEGLRQGFLALDDRLENKGGLEEVADMKRREPPNKSVLLKLLTQPNGESESALPDDKLQLDSIGCTANVVLVDYAAKKVIVANAGDSRAVMGVGGKAVPLSFDHKPDGPEEIERIHKAGSTITEEGRVDGNLNLTRAIGDLKYKQKKHLKPEEHPITANPDTYEYDLSEDADFIIMGCDGVWEQKDNDQMVEWVYDKLQKSGIYHKADL